MVTNAPLDTGGSKLGRLRNRLEKGIRQPSMEHLRRPSMIFRGSHRRQQSVEQIAMETDNLHLSPVISHPKSTASSNNNSFNLSPEIDNVSNFSSPARSVGSMDSLRLQRSAEISPSRASTYPVDTPPRGSVSFSTSAGPLPRISITSDEGVNSIFTSNSPSFEPSKLAKLKNKTISLFFDQDPTVGSPQNITPTRERSPSTGDKTAPVRPKLHKALSDSKQQTANLQNLESQALKQEKELIRKRSRTLGSLEYDTYHKRSGSIVKTIGSMVMLKARNPDTPTGSISDSSDWLTASQSTTPPLISADDTPKSYVAKLVDDGFHSEVSTILSNDDSEFLKKCLDEYMHQTFDFTEMPLDIALRELLMTCELPREAQQIDRVLESFSNRFYECNTTLWDNKDQVYFLTFSLVMLHTDHFNSHNKRKMTKDEFIKNTRVDNPDLKINNAFLSRELFEYLYDNITLSKFFQRNQLQQPQPQPLYLLPKRIFSSSSSTNLESIPNTRHHTHRSQSISSTTSQFFAANIADPYFYIITEQLESLRLDLDNPQIKSPYEDRLKHAFPESVFKKVRQAVTDKNGAFMRFSKDTNWLPGRTDIVTTDEEDLEDNLKCLLRVVKCAELYKEETVSNKFFSIGSANKVVWKKCYGMLTLCGFFIFDNLNFMTVTERESLLGDEEHKEPLIIDVLSESAIRSCKKLSINGLFACQNASDDNHHTFNIFSTNKRELFSTPTFSTMSLWISAINYVASLDSCYMDYPVYFNREVVPIRNISVDDKASKLIANLPTSRKKINDLLRLEGHLRIVTPLAVKTKDILIAHHHSLKIRLDWLWYEVERNQAYLSILRNEITQQTDDMYSMKEDESFLEDSFINHELSTVENIVRMKSHLNVVTNLEETDNEDEHEGEILSHGQDCVLVNGDCSTEDVDNHETYEISRRDVENLFEEAGGGEEDRQNDEKDEDTSDGEDVFVDAETHDLSPNLTRIMPI